VSSAHAWWHQPGHQNPDRLTRMENRHRDALALMRPLQGMRHGLALAMLASALSVALGVCAVARGGVTSSPRTAAARAAPAHVVPSGLEVIPDLFDPSCNGGSGFRLALEKNEMGEPGSSVTSGTLADGSTLLAQTEIYPGRPAAVLESITPQCVPDLSFGSAGIATLAVPPRLHSVIPVPAEGGPSEEGLSLYVVAPSADGDAIVGGDYDRAWILGEVTPSGTLDTSFGDGGWAVLPFHGSVARILQEPSGRLLIAGGNGGGGCCTRNWVAALSARGEVERDFGAHGREELPTGEDSGVDQLLRWPDGEILAMVGHGNMGCWGSTLAALTPSGQLVPGFAGRLDRFWHTLGFKAFVGDVDLDGAGFTLVGTGQRPCFEAPKSSKAPATGLIVRFHSNGSIAGPLVRFRSTMLGSVRAFPDGDDVLVVGKPYRDPSPITITARHLDGSIDPSFANHGTAQIRALVHGTEPEFGEISVAEASPTTLLLVSIQDAQLQLDRLRL